MTVPVDGSHHLPSRQTGGQFHGVSGKGQPKRLRGVPFFVLRLSQYWKSRLPGNGRLACTRKHPMDETRTLHHILLDASVSMAPLAAEALESTGILQSRCSNGGLTILQTRMRTFRQVLDTGLATYAWSNASVPDSVRNFSFQNKGRWECCCWASLEGRYGAQGSPG